FGRALLPLYSAQHPASRRPAQPHARAARSRRLEEVTFGNRPTVGVVYRQGSGTWPQCGALTMRRKLSPGAVAAACVAALTASGMQTVTAGDIPAQVFDRTVYLDSRAMEELRSSNPDHYARAERILAAANHLCRPHVSEVYLAEVGVRDFSCAPMLLLTSVPPKRQIGFRLDRTRYIARVVLTDDPPRLLPAR